VTEVRCSGCRGLTQLPEWENVIEVHCHDCRRLIQLPQWKDIIRIGCSFCSGLTQLPRWENVVHVNCSHCLSLTQLPEWENVSLVDCSFCPGLTQLPEWGDDAFVVSNLVKKRKFVFDATKNQKVIGTCMTCGDKNEIVRCKQCVWSICAKCINVWHIDQKNEKCMHCRQAFVS
jgi:LSD1 subclass zinc finger protein